MKKYIWASLAGGCAGIVTGLFGAGGGMILVPLLRCLTETEEEAVFPTSVSVILPICLTSLCIRGDVPWKEALPYLPGSFLGGWLAGRIGHKIPVVWLRRSFGIFILWGGIRYLW